MALRDLAVPEAKVVVTDSSSFAVRGLGLDSILGLFHRHRGELSALFDRYVADARAKGGVAPEDVTALGSNLLDAAPMLAIEVIALGSGSDPSNDADWLADLAVARTLPIAAQLDALAKIAEMTFTSDMPPKKVAAVVLQAMQGATAMVVRQPAPAA